MPAMYTHHAFAKEVRERLKPPYQKIADTFENEYMIGAQGPDFLFFYYPFTKNKVKDEGERIHHEAARLLFEPAREVLREKGLDSAYGAYVMGLLCHFMLDSSCHGTVEEQIGHTGLSHAGLEGELDWMLMTRDGLDPAAYQPAGFMNPDLSCAAVVASFYPGVTQEKVHKSLKALKWYKNFLVAEHKGKRFVLVTGMKCTGVYHKFGGLMMGTAADPRAEQAVSLLYRLYQDAIGNTARLVKDYMDGVKTKEPLAKRFERNFE